MGRFISFLFSFYLLGQSFGFASPMDDWIRFERARSLKHLHDNYKHAGVKAGAFIASPSKNDPNYFYHWVRDAAISIEPFVEAYSLEPNPEKKGEIGKWLKDYIAFSILIAETPNRSGGRGEPKFNVDGSAYNEEWGRPQNDGPALRAITLIPLASRLMAEGEEDFVRTYLYDGAFPSHSLIKSDLEYIVSKTVEGAIVWTQPTYDLWEETFGDQFYTRMVQRRALRDGAYFAKKMGDPGAAQFYMSEAKAISDSLEGFWREDLQLILPTLKQTRGPQKAKGLDIAILLAALHGDLGAQGSYSFSLTDPRILLTAEKLRDEFVKLYPVNARPNEPGFLLGRYPEDTYDGKRTNGQGNPWFIATLAYVEFLRKLEMRYVAQKKIVLEPQAMSFFQNLMPDEGLESGSVFVQSDENFGRVLSAIHNQANALLLRINRQMDKQTGSMSEQINRNTGKMQGAEDLTWNYAAFLSATSRWFVH